MLKALHRRWLGRAEQGTYGRADSAQAWTIALAPMALWFGLVRWLGAPAWLTAVGLGVGAVWAVLVLGLMFHALGAAAWRGLRRYDRTRKPQGWAVPDDDAGGGDGAG